MLEVRDLQVYYTTKRGYVRAVDGVSFSLQKGENLGLVGESGCGKTTIAKALMRLLQGNVSYHGGEILFQDRDILQMSERDLNRLRWEEISLIPQSAMNALDPVYNVGSQMVEAIHIHRSVSKREALDRAKECFNLVGLEQSRLQAYPHELSGGMKQRVAIAMALVLEPSLIIADEPTTALDVVVQDGILAQLEKIQGQLNNSMVMVTHDISVVSEICDKVVVMYGGKVMEYGATKDVLRNPAHPYTMGLGNAFPSLAEAVGELVSIPGAPPDLRNPPPGCRFQQRCPFAKSVCREDPPLQDVGSGRVIACHFPEERDAFRSRSALAETWRPGESGASGPQPAGKGSPQHEDRSVLQVNGLHRYFRLKQPLWDRVRRRPPRILKALDGVSLEVRSGEILGLAGESGSGKSTLAEILCRLQTKSAGRILYEGEDTESLRGAKLAAFRRNFQMVFQDPYETLNPRFTVFDTVNEPLKIHGVGNVLDRIGTVERALKRAGLEPTNEMLAKFPHQLSGGQRQRIALARAIVLDPEFIVADEPVSMLDVSIRAGILNLLKRFKEELQVSIIYVSHDLATIRYICDRTAIIYLGRIMEMGPTEQVITEPRHPYTRMLIDAVPRIGDSRKKVDVKGDIADASYQANGCRFHPRCPLATPKCGWEGRDLRQQLQLQEQQWRYEKQGDTGFFENITGYHLQGRDLFVNMAGDERSVRQGIEGVVRETKPAMLKALQRVETVDSGLRFCFSEQEEPGLEETTEGHLHACPYS